MSPTSTTGWTESNLGMLGSLRAAIRPGSEVHDRPPRPSGTLARTFQSGSSVRAPRGSSTTGVRHVRAAWVCSSHRRAEPDDIAVEIDERTFVLSPLGVLRAVHLGASGTPLLCETVGVV